VKHLGGSCSGQLQTRWTPTANWRQAEAEIAHVLLDRDPETDFESTENVPADFQFEPWAGFSHVTIFRQASVTWGYAIAS
jgi:hypothetical protein